MNKLFRTFIVGYNSGKKNDINYNLEEKYFVNPILEAMRITIIYGIAGGLWIICSNDLLRRFSNNIDIYAKLDTYKGLVYLLITMMVIYYTVYKRVLLYSKALKNVYSNNERLLSLEKELKQQFESLEKQRNLVIASEQRYKLAVEGADCGIWDIDVEKDEWYFSPKWKNYLGFENEDIKSCFEQWVDLLHPKDREEAIEKFNDFIISSSRPYENIYRMRCKNGEYKWMLSKAKEIRSSEGKIIRIAGSHTDITNQKLTEEKLHLLAYNDVLTELPNRYALEDFVKKLIDSCKKSNEKFALIYMDVDNFKHINDTLGHFTGDLLLKHIANILKFNVKQPDIVARLSGDEFVIVLNKINSSKEVSNKIDELIKKLKEPWILDDQRYFISFSVGIAMYPENGDNIEMLLKNSDIAMYYIKKNMKDNYCFYLPRMQEKSLEQVRLINDLRHAIDNEEFVLYYQPIIDLKTMKFIGVEALIRWIHPLKGLIPPMDFIPLAEESGLIYDLEKWILRAAFQQKSKWEKLNNMNIKISVNISGKTIIDEGFAGEINELLSKTEIKNSQLQLEVTETAFIEKIDLSIEIINKIKNMGIKIALDDFGTGYSSLTYIKKLPIDVIKLDRKFINSITKEKKDKFIVEHVIKLTHELDLKIVAEGIETVEQLEFLKANNCDYGQGYLFSKPVTADDIEKLAR